ncbi:MAG: mechanosensitive ion channel family protein [Gemmatimonadota bacterium]
MNDALRDSWDKIEGWMMGAIRALPNFIVAILILVVFFYLARFLRDLIFRLLGRVSEYSAVNRLLSTVAFTGLILIGLLFSLSVLNLSTAVTSILGAAGILGLAIGFAAQDTVSNLISGVMISVRRPLREGDLVDTNDTFGVVDQVNLRATVVRTPTGQIVFVSNKNVFQNRLTNYSRSGQRRIDLSCGVSYGDDLEKAKRVALEAVGALENRVQGRDVELFYNEFGDSSINFTLRFWINFSRSQAEYLAAQSDAIMALKRAFDDNEITIPFPIRTLDFGALGGVTLSEELGEADRAAAEFDRGKS